VISSVQTRIELLAKLQAKLEDQETWPKELFNKVKAVNPWFTQESIKKSIAAITANYLDKSKLESWIAQYSYNNKVKRVGLILAGNIPLVGFHDILAVFVAGHVAQIKLSDKDKILTEHILTLFKEIDVNVSDHFEFVERMSNYDAIIATGSNSSSRYFEKYFSSVPHIIRRNRNAVGVIYNDTTEEELGHLGYDILSYFGLGCRNISKLYLEEGIELARIFEAIEKHKDIINHHKYKNNYDYSYALYLLNKEEFYTNDFLIMRPNKAISSRISVLHYDYFENEEQLAQELQEKNDQVQCIISSKALSNLQVYNFGQSQQPSLTDYADGVDTMQFLLDL